jgi:antitoxin component of RelBE/YafQ-DinJ toxin-antitoxin module
LVWAKAVRAAGALRMNPPAAIDTLFNRIARREALPADPVVKFDTALPPLEFQVEARFLRKTSFRFLAPAASSNFPPPLGVGVEADTTYGSARTPAAFNAAA